MNVTFLRGIDVVFEELRFDETCIHGMLISAGTLKENRGETGYSQGSEA